MVEAFASYWLGLPNLFYGHDQGSGHTYATLSILYLETLLYRYEIEWKVSYTMDGNYSTLIDRNQLIWR